MSSGTFIQLFNNFMEATGPQYVTPPDEIINDAQLFRTYSFGALMGGDFGKKKMYSGGSEIRFSTFLEASGATRFHQPGATRNWIQPQKLVHGRAFHRYLETHMTWTRQTIMHNEKARYGDDTMRFQQFVDERRHLEQQCQTDLWNFLENHMWSEPDFAEMESSSGGVEGKFYSMAAFINYFPDGLFNKSSGAAAGTPWTTIEGIDTANTAKNQDSWIPKTRTYNTTISNEATLFSNGNVLAAFDKMWKDVHYEMPPTMEQYFSNPAYNNQQIFCSPEGQTAYQQALRNSQDLFVVGGRQDPAYADPTYNFIPVKYVQALTTATLYPNHATIASATDNVAEGDTTANFNTGPRYYWVNSNYLYPVFHEEMYFARGKVREHFNDPDTFVLPVWLWGNLICTSRPRQGIIHPSADVYTSLYT